ncbi:CDP-glycerol glycerophosphotransferase family protein [Fusobacterium mortiferum]|uniref:CDP-glycerol glycerophosphotransferase family protein n=1 Tax=Fusobacterium mortiferum TaxID=850 RepID=UPI0022DF689F|nr:CDP-glycerol glycerophosphotransferase family protein [Fusobacterium mortiferum]
MELKKNVTFIYTDKTEYQQLYPIYLECKKRGYKVEMSNNIFKKNEIGVYCQHLCYPENSKFSVILFHDIGQRHGEWPNMWQYEPWNKFNIGILPSKEWTDRWYSVSEYSTTNPKNGVVELGWPKFDRILEEGIQKDINEIKKKLDPNKKTILYAPSWENDNKQDEFVKSMLNLKEKVNILIKQAWYNEEIFPERVKDIKKMYRLHKEIEGVTILPPETNIFDAILVSDILVSEESSTMFEAMLLGIPSVAVTDWKIPDVVPSRFAIVPYSFVEKTEKRNLTLTVKNILENYSFKKKEIINYRDRNFKNLGKASIEITNLLDLIVAKEKVTYIKGKKITRKVTIFNNMHYRKYNIIKIKNWIKNRIIFKSKILKKLFFKYKEMRGKN